MNISINDIRHDSNLINRVARFGAEALEDLIAGGSEYGELVTDEGSDMAIIAIEGIVKMPYGEWVASMVEW